MILSSKIKVAVLRGGSSDGYDASLKTGKYVLSVLRDMPETYEPLDIFISKEGEWHHEGLVREPHRAVKYADVIWNALHGSYGENGQVQKFLGSFQIPFTGSSAIASVLATNQDMAKRLYQRHFLATPAYKILTENNLSEKQLIDVFRNFLPPIVVKPVRYISGGMFLANTFNELKESIKKTFNLSPRVLIEEFIKGKNVTCTIIERGRGEKIYALLPVLSNIQQSDRLGTSEFRLRVNENKEIERMAKQAHEALGLSHYSSSDFIVSPKRKIYILRTNPSPELHPDSLVHHSLDITGWRPRDFVDHVIKLAM